MNSRTNENFNRFKEVQKECKKAVASAKRRFEKNIASKGTKRPFNSYVKSKTKSRTNVGPLKVNNKLFSENKDMAQVLNDFFVSVFTKENDNDVLKMPKLPCNSTVLNIEFDSMKVKEKILKLKSSSAPGPGSISTRFR